MFTTNFSLFISLPLTYSPWEWSNSSSSVGGWNHDDDDDNNKNVIPHTRWQVSLAADGRAADPQLRLHGPIRNVQMPDDAPPDPTSGCEQLGQNTDERWAILYFNDVRTTAKNFCNVQANNFVPAT